MPAPQATKRVTMAIRRRRSVPRQASAFGASAMRTSLPSGDDGTGGRFVRNDTLEDERVLRGGLNHLQPVLRELLDPIGPGQASGCSASGGG